MQGQLPYEIFVADIEVGNDEQLIVKALVESFDLCICGNSRLGGNCGHVCEHGGGGGVL